MFHCELKLTALFQNRATAGQSVRHSMRRAAFECGKINRLRAFKSLVFSISFSMQPMFYKGEQPI